MAGAYAGWAWLLEGTTCASSRHCRAGRIPSRIRCRGGRGRDPDPDPDPDRGGGEAGEASARRREKREREKKSCTSSDARAPRSVMPAGATSDE